MLPTSEKLFSSVIPGPNPTGNLHVGHVLNLCLQDVFIRWKDINGYKVHWISSLDHGATSTQEVVTKKVRKEVGKDYSEQAYFDAQREWIDNYTSIILDEFKMLRLSLVDNDQVFMTNPMFTEFCQNFLQYLESNSYVYSKHVVTPWSFKLQTSTDLADYRKANVNKSVYICKIVNDVTGNNIEFRVNNLFELVSLQGISSTSEGELISSKLTELFGHTELQILQGSGTENENCAFCPSHNINDFELALSKNLDVRCNVDADGTILNGSLAGLNLLVDKFKIISALKQQEVIVEEISLAEKESLYRLTNEPIVYFYSQQTMLDAHKLAEKAIATLESSCYRIEPDSMRALTLTLLQNIKNKPAEIVNADWAIQRMLSCGTPINKGESIHSHGAKFDMKFSCSLWAFFTHHYYVNDRVSYSDLVKNSICTTGTDLIPFWIVPILLLSETDYLPVPFSHVIVHPLICDKNGEKMSKSLGNVVSPTELIDEFGVDALRLYIISQLGGEEFKLLLNKENISKMNVFLNKLEKLKTSVKGHTANLELKNLFDKVETALDQYTLKELGNSLDELMRVMIQAESISQADFDRAQVIFSVITGHKT